MDTFLLTQFSHSHLEIIFFYQDLKDLMRKAGEVTYADAHKQHRNQGVVEFASRRDMERALDKFDDYDLNGRRIKVSIGS